jgi:hypothetical protein
MLHKPIPVAERSETSDCGQSLVRIAGLNPASCVVISSLVSVVCSPAEVSAMDGSLIQRSLTDFGMS